MVGSFWKTNVARSGSVRQHVLAVLRFTPFTLYFEYVLEEKHWVKLRGHQPRGRKHTRFVDTTR